MPLPERLDWSRHGPEWAHPSHSDFVSAGGWRWHVQRFGGAAGGRRGSSCVLLLHGTGSAGHSFRHLAPLLGQHVEVIVPDLPGHGFTRSEGATALGLPDMAHAVAALMTALGRHPRWLVGHSAGAAVAARWCLDAPHAADALVALNGALLPLGGAAGLFFSPIARWLVLNPLVPQLFSWRASDPQVTRQLLDSTGSRLGAEAVALYARLLRDPGHVGGALRMMAAWDLAPLARQLPQLPCRLALVAAEDDGTLPAAHALRVRELVPASELIQVPRGGHLLHEADAAGTLALLRRLLPDALGAG